MAREAVKINVYDMTSLNSYISAVGIGIYHCGIQIYNTEFGYGGHPFSFSGVFEIEPRNEVALGEENFKYRETITIGFTDFDDDEVREIVKNMGNEFKGDQYHLLHRNCNHFSDALSKILCGKGIPSWVNRLAYACTCVPFLERCLPQEFLTPVILEENIRDQVSTINNAIKYEKNESQNKDGPVRDRQLKSGGLLNQIKKTGKLILYIAELCNLFLSVFTNLLIF